MNGLTVPVLRERSLLVSLAMASFSRVASLVLGKRTRAGRQGGEQTTVGFVPRPFALHGFSDADDGPLLAWGMTLPDGSAVTVDWRHGPSSGITISTNAEQAACLHGADLVWLTRS